MLTSKPFWALMNEKFVQAWSTSLLAFCLPLYIKDVYDMNIEKIGWISSVPHYFEFIVRIPSALLADYLRRNKIWSKTTVHKTYILVAQLGAVVFLCMAALTNNLFVPNMMAFALFELSFTQAFISYAILPVDMAGRYNGVLYGLGNTAESIGSILNPLLIGIMITNHTFAEWSKYFFLISSLNAWAAIIFAIYGSGELQSWAVEAE